MRTPSNPLQIVHLTASGFFGGPERQMLEMARDLPADMRVSFLSFGEAPSREFLARIAAAGFRGQALRHDFPRLAASLRELIATLRRLGADILCCHGYKADLLGLAAARRLGIPVVAVSRGWTGETRRVRLYEALDRRLLRAMDRVVCVSEAQAAKVLRCGVPAARTRVIHNSIRVERFAAADVNGRAFDPLFARRPRAVVGAVGRLSPEKGFHVLVEAAAEVVRQDDSIGFVLYGAGREREALERRIAELGLGGSFLLPGFCAQLEPIFPQFDLCVLPSFTEGLSNVVLEALAAAVPVIATNVGGNPELVADGENGYLVPAGESGQLARRILQVLGDPRRRSLGRRGQQRVREQFSFARQAALYAELFRELAAAGANGGPHAIRRAAHAADEANPAAQGITS